MFSRPSKTGCSESWEIYLSVISIELKREETTHVSFTKHNPINFVRIRTKKRKEMGIKKRKSKVSFQAMNVNSLGQFLMQNTCLKGWLYKQCDAVQSSCVKTVLQDKIQFNSSLYMRHNILTTSSSCQIVPCCCSSCHVRLALLWSACGLMSEAAVPRHPAKAF